MAAVARIQTTLRESSSHQSLTRSAKFKSKVGSANESGSEPLCTHFNECCHGIAMEISLPIHQLIALETSVNSSKRH